MTVETDSHGRLYLSSELRDRYGEKFHVVEYEDRIELIPIDDDPLEAARDAAGDAFEGESAEELRQEALEQSKSESREDIQPARREDDG
ncbi:MAG: AbrB/MazE/SpoVT family DNA-binding domain-containing protein [Halobacteria archaeon]|nr:AbrB/MazE/SpoVT family DNA-binding domain-containing protein [Halobacteria archaeon]